MFIMKTGIIGMFLLFQLTMSVVQAAQPANPGQLQQQIENLNQEMAAEASERKDMYNAVKADIADNAAGIADNAAGIADNAAGVADNAAGVADNAAGVADNAAGIADNTADIADNTADIADNTADIADNTTAIANTRAAICDIVNFEGLSPRPDFCLSGLQCPCWQGRSSDELLAALNAQSASVIEPICSVITGSRALAGDNDDTNPVIDSLIAGGANGSPQQGMCAVIGLSGIDDANYIMITIQEALTCIKEATPIVSQVNWCP